MLAPSSETFHHARSQMPGHIQINILLEYILLIMLTSHVQVYIVYIIYSKLSLHVKIDCDLTLFSRFSCQSNEMKHYRFLARTFGLPQQTCPKLDLPFLVGFEQACLVQRMPDSSPEVFLQESLQWSVSGVSMKHIRGKLIRCNSSQWWTQGVKGLKSPSENVLLVSLKIPTDLPFTHPESPPPFQEFLDPIHNVQCDSVF